MNRIIVNSQVAADGVLHVQVPVGEAYANQVVRVTIEPLPPARTPEEWRSFVLSLAGAWQGDLERPEQGPYEERDPLG
jgi:hypothetical protein